MKKIKNQKTKKYIQALHVTRYALRVQRGFTLIEVLISMAIVIGIAFFVLIFGRDITNYSIRFNSSLLTQQEMQQTLQLMLPEIRSAAQSNAGNYPILSAASTSFAFFSDIDRNGTFDQVRYFLSSSTFTKGVIKPTGSPLSYPSSSEVFYELVHNMIGSQIFTYYDTTATTSESAPLVSPVDVLKIKMIKVTLVANQGTAKLPSIVGVESQATIRNLRYQ